MNRFALYLALLSTHLLADFVAAAPPPKTQEPIAGRTPLDVNPSPGAQVKTVTALGEQKKDEKADDEQTQLNKALDKALFRGKLDEKTAKDLLKKGANIQWQDPVANRKTPLTKAVVHERLDVVKFLLENGADIHSPDGSGRCPVLFCCINNSPELLMFLLSKGAGKDINRGPLHILVTVCDHGQGSPELIPLIVKAGASPDVFQGNVTPLIAAIQLNPAIPGRTEKSRAYVKALIENKADVNLRDRKEKMSPLQWAKKRGDAAIIDMLEKAGAKE